MKILIIRNFPSYMSVKKNTYNIQEVGLAKALVKKGHICDVLFWTDKEEECVEIPVEETEKSIRIFYKRGKTFLKNTVYTGCESLFKQYDILQPCEYNQIQSWLLAKQYPEKTIIFHGPYYSPFNKRYNLMCKVFDMLFLHRYLKLETRFLAKSVMAKDFLFSKGIKEKDITVCGVGIDTQVLSNHERASEQEIYQDMKAHENILKLLYIGRLEERRNIPFIMEVLKKLKEKIDVRLYMIGTGDKEYMDRIWNLVDRYNLKDSIVWQERMEQKYLSDIYKEADIFLLPTSYEIFGMVLLEAMYYRTVTITTYNGGSSTLIQNEANGIIINELDADKWVETICQISKDKETLENIQNNAHEKIEREFLWDRLIPNFENAYFRK